MEHYGFKIFVAYIIPLFLIASSSFAANVYKYKDSAGNWVYSDKPPITDVKVETTQYADTVKKRSPIKTQTLYNQGVYDFIVENTLYAPVEIELTFLHNQEKSQYVIPAKSKKVIYSNEEPMPKSLYRWIIGDPSKTPDNFSYKLPFSSGLPKKVTQSFNGRFSHNKSPNNFAVDIAMPVGTYITAARDGTVIEVKDDYHMGGKTAYFLDKANKVTVLHEDGTYALYAHILLGTAQVKLGDKVKVGDVIARSGSSGYSTGPHLHFIIYKNAGFNTVSIPFVFQSGGRSVTPKRGMMLQYSK